MSDSTASSRALSGAEEFDRRILSIGQAPSDALAELARLVGQQDPFRPGAGGLPPKTPPGHPPLAPSMAFDEAFQASIDAGEEPGAPTEPAVVHASVPEPQAWERVVPRFPSISSREPNLIEPTPDVWARGADEDREDGADVPALIATRETAPGTEQTSAGRTLVVLAAVIALTGSGLAASFLAKPSASMASASETPTILAATGPIKVQPETPAAGEDASSEPSKLLDKNKNDGTSEAKVVNTIEQPVDLAQAIKPAAPEVVETPASPPSPFPEPRKVKTILVRPDGSIIADAVPAPVEMPISAANQEASLAFDTRTALPSVRRDEAPVAAALPADPVVADPAPATAEAAKPPIAKTTARVAPAKPAASTAQDGSAAAQARTSVATPKTKPVAHIAAKPKPKPLVAAAPVVVADAGPAAEAPAATEPAAVTPTEKATGSFAIQLGAALSEAEGQAAASKLGQKYAGDLGGAQPSVVKAQSGGKTVYRIRVGSLSQDSAKALCVKVQAGGGGCFVAR